MSGGNINFGRFRFDPARRELSREGVAVRLGGRARDILSMLAAAGGEVRVTASVVGAMAPKLEQEEIERARRKPTGSFDAYDYYLRGLAHTHQVTREATDEALRLLARASKLDPEFATPHGLAAFCYVIRKTNGWMLDRSREVEEAATRARRAAELGSDDAVALSFGGFALGYVAGELDDAAAIIERVLAFNPNLPFAWLASGVVQTYRDGAPDVAIEHATRAMRLSPLDPYMFLMRSVIAFAHFVAGRYDEASEWAEQTLRENPRIIGTLRVAAASHALAGRAEEAQQAIASALALDADMRLSNLTDRAGPIRRADDYARYVDALRKAGLPE